MGRYRVLYISFNWGRVYWKTILPLPVRFGEVVDCVVMKNVESGRSRGFGFVTFSDPANMEKVIQSCPHVLDGRTIDPKPCNPRSMQQKPKRNTNCPKVSQEIRKNIIRILFGLKIEAHL